MFVKRKVKVTRTISLVLWLELVTVVRKQNFPLDLR
jgi:hypothetical protein